MRSTVRAFLSKNFIAGLLVTLPLGITWMVALFIVRRMDALLHWLPWWLDPNSYLPFRVPGLGVLLTFSVIVLAGLLVRSYAVRRVVAAGERLMRTLPFLSKIYAAVKQILEVSLRKDSQAFRKVGLIEFPRPGIYSLVFLTGATPEELQRAAGRRLLNVFYPTTPNPTTGFYLMLPEEQVRILEMSVEDAFRLIISAGIVGKDARAAGRAKRPEAEPS